MSKFIRAKSPNSKASFPRSGRSVLTRPEGGTPNRSRAIAIDCCHYLLLCAVLEKSPIDAAAAQVDCHRYFDGETLTLTKPERI